MIEMIQTILHQVKLKLYRFPRASQLGKEEFGLSSPTTPNQLLTLSHPPHHV